MGFYREGMKCQYLQTQCTTCRLRAGVVQIPCRHRADTVPAGCCISGYYCTYLCCCVSMLQSAVEQRVQIAREHRKLSSQVVFGVQATYCSRITHPF